MHVCFLDPLEDRIKEFPGRYLADHQIAYANGQPADVPGDTEVLITWSGLLDRDLVSRLPDLRLVQRIGYFRGGGDLQAAADRGVEVAVWPHGVLNRVAMHTLMFMVALSRQLLPGHELTIEGVNESGMEPTFADQRPLAMNWPRIANVDTPANKTLGIIGFGEAGACLAHLAAPLDMEILYYKRTRLSPEQEAFYGVEYAPLDDLLRQSDFVATFVPYSTESEKTFGAREFGLMKPTAYFLNTGRANTTDEAALIDALKDKRIAGAGLDVFSYEPLPPDNPLPTLKNVVLTPHNAGGVGGWHDVFERISRNVQRVEAGRRPVSWGVPPA
ncbi:MAG TPA: NAD(P)-dependent oxidoreductase [Chloroflexota bacterium]|nr:NAD(P)-dependent oxidoreductase [Chloroflexota bacterium]